MRLFAGLALPPEAAQRLTELRLRMATQEDGLRWSEPDQWHITLRFCGEVTEEQAALFGRALATLRSPPVNPSMDALRTFDAKGILYASIVPSEDLMVLQRQVDRCLPAHDTLPESHPFRPHITLARSRNRSGMISLRRLSRPALPAFGREIRWTADEVLLYESVLGSMGAHYTVRERFLLQ